MILRQLCEHFNKGLQMVQHISLLRYQLLQTGTIFLLTPRLTQEMELFRVTYSLWNFLTKLKRKYFKRINFIGASNKMKESIDELAVFSGTQTEKRGRKKTLQRMGGRLSCAKKHVIKKEKLIASMSPESTVITMEREYSTDTFTTMAEAEESGCLDYDSLSFLTRFKEKIFGC